VLLGVLPQVSHFISVMIKFLTCSIILQQQVLGVLRL
jgi:hypothetical protein